MKKIPIMFTFNDNYSIPASACFISIMENSNSKYEYDFYVLTSDISNEHRDMLLKDMSNYKNCRLEFIDMHNQFEQEYNNIKNHSHFSKELLYKLNCASIFPDLDKIIITDVDVVFLDDIAKMYDAFNAKDNYYYAGIGPIKTNKPSYYRSEAYKLFDEEDIIKLEAGVGAGFLLVNLYQIRKQNIEKKMFDYLQNNSDKLIQIEQDVINIVCYNHIKKMPHYYMVCSYEYDEYNNDLLIEKIVNKNEIKELKYALENPLQLHYATTIKPWIYTDSTKNELWFKFFKMSLFSEKYLTEIMKNGKSVNSFFIKFMKTKLYRVLLKIYHIIKR